MAAVRSIAVGTFILSALAIGVAIILFFGGSRLFVHHIRLVAFFEGSVAGLQIGAPVTFRGVRIGLVRQISVRLTSGNAVVHIPVILELDPHKIAWQDGPLIEATAHYRQLVDSGLRAELQLQSLITGEMNVNLDFRPGSPAHIVGGVPELPEIPTVPSDYERLRENLLQLQLRNLTDSAEHALNAIQQLSTHLDKVIDPLTGSVRRTADTATRTLQTVDSAIQRVQRDASSALHGVTALTDDARRQINSRGDDLGRAIARVDDTARKAGTLIDSLNELTAPRSQLRGDLESAARDLAATAGSLRNFSQALERDPSALLTGATQ